MVGFTPSLSTAVWVGTTDGARPLVNQYGSPVYGSGLPSDIWKETMDGALDGTDEETFPKPTEIGGYAGVPQAPVRAPSSSTTDVTTPPPPSESVIQPTLEIAPGITIPFGPPTTVTAPPPPPVGVDPNAPPPPGGGPLVPGPPPGAPVPALPPPP
jgi:membrane peptidoglycan carboxypeptidase